MKKIRFLILLTFLVFMFFGIKFLYACDLSIISEKNEVYVGEEIKVTIERVKTHKTCVLPIEETEIQVINGEIVSEGEWVKSTKDTKEIVVKFNEPGVGIIKVIRDCPKGGLMVWTKEFNVLSLPTTQPSDSQPSNPTTPTSPDTTPNTSTPTTPSNTTTQIDPSNTTTPTSPSSNSTTPQNQPENELTSQDPINQTEEIKDNNNNETTNNSTSENLNSKDDILKALENYLFNPQTLLYIILIILSIIFVSLKLYKLRFFTLLFSLAILGFYFGGCLCPVSYIGKLFTVNFLSITFYIFLGLVIFISIITLFKGRVFCGWVCPHGALQEFIYKVKTKRFEKIEKYLKYVKYFVFASVVALSFIYSKNYFCEVYPFKVLYNFSGTGFILIFAIITLFVSIFIYRPFCRFICPFGAYLGLISKLGEK
ncbi:MAG: 4Fe-4S binding protein [Caldisericia bacterium]|nr:4Fe-4S binding protein [Caldisericia bacterium]